jgi:REP element-mobilizing transposase RayT
MRVARVPSLRSQRCIGVLRAALRANKQKLGFRLVHYAVQPDHLHFIVEARGKAALSRGAKAIAIGIAMRLNAMLGRAGKVFADRYHVVALGSPRHVRRALAYVLLQERRHAAKRGAAMTVALDACSSAPLFDGWKSEAPRAGPWSETVVEAKTWLLTAGWRRQGKIDPAEVPGRRR